MWNDYHGKAVLVTGGTAGIGLATGLRFAERGARVVLTYRWGEHDEQAIRDQFAEVGEPAPHFVEADVADEEQTDALFAEIATLGLPLEAIVSNVGFAQLVSSWEDFNLRGLTRSIEYSAWPMVVYTLKAREVLGRFPRYVVALSSCGTTTWHLNYDFVAAAKAVLETLVRYVAHRMRNEDCRVNALRARWVDTASLTSVAGHDFVPFVQRFPMPGQMQTPQEVADAVFALCSGWMDGLQGEVVTVDHGTGFADNLMRLWAERDRFALPEPKSPGGSTNPIPSEKETT